MQTVIGSNGQIGYELAKELNQTYSIKRTGNSCA